MFGYVSTHHEHVGCNIFRKWRKTEEKREAVCAAVKTTEEKIVTHSVERIRPHARPAKILHQESVFKVRRIHVHNFGSYLYTNIYEIKNEGF
jgi:hypothetical protein